MATAPSHLHGTGGGPEDVQSTTRDEISWGSIDRTDPPSFTEEHYHPRNDHQMREQQEPGPPSLTQSQALNLYLSHALSTWNARGYEFAAILFTAAAYPGTLVAAAARMIIIYFAMILFSSSMGSWVDNSSSRLRTLLTTIIINRGSVIIGSLFWLFILSQRDLLLNERHSDAKNTIHDDNDDTDLFLPLPTNIPVKNLTFALAILCGIIERLSASGNLLSMERDWVPTVAAKPEPNSPHKNPYDLTNLNAVMRRIDLVCKLFSPIVLSLVISLSGSTRVGVCFTGVTSAICIPIEILSARRVWRGCPILQQEKKKKKEGSLATTITTTAAVATGTPSPPPTMLNRLMVRLRSYPRDFAMYFTSKQAVWIPSLALALLHFNILTWRATFITYLITVGYSLNVITAARTAGSLFEITSTVITPRAVVYLGRHVREGGREAGRDEDGEAGRGLLDEHEDEEMEGELSDGLDGDMDEDSAERQTLTGLQRTGLWGISWQVAMTVPVVLAIWAIKIGTPSFNTISPSNDDDSTETILTIPNSIILFTFLAMSRLGVWIFDLTTQQLTQTLIPADQRSSFAGVENSITNIFELAGALAAIGFPEPRQYPWLATASLSACFVSWALYAGWVRRQRGHLVHMDRVAGCGGRKM